MTRTFSIIIIFHNEQAGLKNCLLSVLKQNYPQNKYQIILVNDSSKDNSVKTIQTLLQEPNISLINSDKPLGISTARNLAIKKAKGEILFFIDAHIYLQRNTLSIINQKLNQYPQISGVCGQYSAKEKNDYNVIRDLRRIINFKKAEQDFIIDLENFTTFSIAVGAYKKEVFKNNFFPDHFENSAGEDVYVQLKAHHNGHKFLYTSDISAYHDAKLSLKKLLTKLTQEIKGTINIIIHSIENNDHFNLPFLEHFLDYPILIYVFLISFLLTKNIYLGIIFLLAFIIRYSKTVQAIKIKPQFFIQYLIFLIIKDFLQFIALTTLLFNKNAKIFNYLITIKKNQLKNYFKILPCVSRR